MSSHLSSSCFSGKLGDLAAASHTGPGLPRKNLDLVSITVRTHRDAQRHLQRTEGPKGRQQHIQRVKTTWPAGPVPSRAP